MQNFELENGLKTVIKGDKVLSVTEKHTPQIYFSGCKTPHIKFSKLPKQTFDNFIKTQNDTTQQLTFKQKFFKYYDKITNKFLDVFTDKDEI